MTRQAEEFYVSLGMPKLPESYWEKTQFIKPRDRDVVCHASAWDMNMGGGDGKSPDVRTKMCIKPNEEDLFTIYHELGHVYYYLAYNHLPPRSRAAPGASTKRSAHDRAGHDPAYLIDRSGRRPAAQPGGAGQRAGAWPWPR